MNTAEYVDAQIKILKNSGIPLSDAAWQAAMMCLGWPYVFGGRGEYCTPANRRSRYSDSHPTIKTKCKNFDGAGSCSGCKWYPSGKRVRFFDCRGFTYWVLLQVYGWKLMGAGATSQWNNASNWKAQGEVSDGIPSNVIVCLFYYKKDKNGKRTKTLEHTGFYYNGETCECSNGVQHSKTLNNKWEVWGIPACVEGDVPPMPDVKPTLRRGSKGSYVTLAQTKLIQLGYNLPKYGADGSFGAETESAVKTFQKDHGLMPDGVIGQKTWEALENGTVTMYTVVVPHLSLSVADEIVSKYGGTMTLEA